MSFIQKFFTSYKTRADGENLIGELNRLWYDSNTNTIRISDGNPGGKIVSGSSMGSTVYEGPTPPPNPQAGWLWWDSNSGDLFVYYDSNWVSATSMPNTYSIPVHTFAPPSPYAGLMAVANGTTWDPASTGVETLVIYLNNTWVRLG